MLTMQALPRRDFIMSSAGLSAAAIPAFARSSSANTGDPTFQNNVPDPLLAGKELPTFKFALDKSEAKTIGGNSAREATVVQLPISKGIAGVSMRLAPGGMREMHWHATAAEWAFVNQGRVRTTVIQPDGQSETNDFDPGDVWYFPRGHGHMLQCLGNEPCHFVLIFDNGYFSEFGTFSVTDWLSRVPKALLAKNLGVAESSFEGFPVDEVYFAQGPMPPEVKSTPLQGWKQPALTHKFELLKQPPHREFKGGREWRVDSTYFPISQTITAVVLDLEPGALRELHWHPSADEWQYVLEGKISVTMFGSHARFRTETLEQGDVGYIPQGYGHSIENVGDGKARILIGFNSGIYETIDLSQWLAGNPLDVLATNFNKPDSLFQKFPGRDVFVAPEGGPTKSEPPL
jgi:oxalate decarboxylase